ncbi:MAG: sterol desaturase family protein [Elusimicrobiota bacterium]
MDINVYSVATPAVLAIVTLEAAYCLYQKNGYYRFDDAMANFGTAIGHQVTNVAVAVFAFELFVGVRARWPLADWGTTPLSFAALYLSTDFLFYWFHRAGHGINFLWAAHAPHHSSEELNYTVGLRASLTQRLASFLFYWPLALVAKPEVVLPLISLHLLIQLIPHTRVITRLPRWIEGWLNTPTHHRVHHGINPKYLDKNFGGSFIVWDKLFGTYAEETEPVVYGVLRPVNTWSPVEINLQYWKLFWRDAVDAPRWSDKLKLWFMPNGWRPEVRAGEAAFRAAGAGPKPAVDPAAPAFGSDVARHDARLSAIAMGQGRAGSRDMGRRDRLGRGPRRVPVRG